MSFPVELGSLLLYAVQQLGVMLSVGAQTILLIAYLISIRDTVIDKKETEFAIAITRVLRMGLLLIVLSGAGAAAFHLLLGQVETILTPAFLFKWILIGLAIGLTLAQGKTPYPRYLILGLAGATWYALFTLHILAPITTWLDLGVLYAVWTTGFVLLWSLIIFAFRKREKKFETGEQKPLVAPQQAPQQKIVPQPPPKIVAPPPVVNIPKPSPPHIKKPEPLVVPKPVVVEKKEAPVQVVPLKPIEASKSVFAAPVPQKPVQINTRLTEPKPVPNIVIPQKPVVVSKPEPAPLKPLPHFSATQTVPMRPKNIINLSSIGKLAPRDSQSKEFHPLPAVPLDHTMSEAPHKPEAPAMAIPQKPVPQKPPVKPALEEPIKEVEEYFELPAIRVMPRSPEEIANQNRPGVVQFN